MFVLNVEIRTNFVEDYMNTNVSNVEKNQHLHVHFVRKNVS